MSITNPSDPAFNPGSGVSFTNYFGAATACTPARAAWLTGLYAPQTRMYNTAGEANQPSLDPGFPSWGAILTDSQGNFGFRSLGYKTAWIGKWHVSATHTAPDGLIPYGYGYCWPARSPNGFINEGASGGVSGFGSGSNAFKSDAQIVTNFQNWITNYGHANPWCVTVGLVNPHDISGAPLGFGAVLDPQNSQIDQQVALSHFGVAFPVSTTFPAGGFKGSVFDGYFSNGPLAAGISNWEDVQTLAASGIKAKLQASTMAGRQQNLGLRNSDGSTQPFTSKSFARMLDVYLWLQAMVDLQIGLILNRIWTDASLRANTIILFTSDHGEFAGAHGMSGKTGALYDEGIHIPLSVWLPYAVQDPQKAAQYSGTRGNVCSAVDFCPLILTLASGSENWRQTAALAHLKTRQSLAGIMSQNQAASLARSFTLSTCQEFVGDEEFTGQTSGQHHVIAYRDTGGKYVRYSYWQSCTDTVDSTQAQFTEFYDYARGNTAELGNDVPSSPSAATYAQSFTNAVAKEFVVPPPGLSVPYGNALTNFLSYVRQRDSSCQT
jgi:arylsulfatase A-like enzyme